MGCYGCLLLPNKLLCFITCKQCTCKVIRPWQNTKASNVRSLYKSLSTYNFFFNNKAGRNSNILRSKLENTVYFRNVFFCIADLWVKPAMCAVYIVEKLKLSYLHCITNCFIILCLHRTKKNDNLYIYLLSHTNTQASTDTYKKRIYHVQISLQFSFLFVRSDCWFLFLISFCSPCQHHLWLLISQYNGAYQGLTLFELLFPNLLSE